MSDMVNLVRVLTSATGNSTPITLGSAYSQLFMTPAEAGAVNGRVYTYLIVDANNWELGKGVYTSSGNTLARTTILASRNAGTLGTSRISLSGTAQVRLVQAAEDIGGLRGTRNVTGTTDTIANTDLGRAITYSNAGAIAASLAQAGTSGLLDGWCTWTKNTGPGSVTITPAPPSTINGASTLVVPKNIGAFIWSDGTNYHALMLAIGRPLLAANNLADLTDATEARENLGATEIGDALFTAADAEAARAALGTSDADRQNDLLMIYQSKALASPRRAINSFADGFKADGGLDDSSSGYTLDTTNGLVKPEPSVTSNQISQSAGTAIGDMTSGGGLAAAFDGVTNQAQAASATSAPAGSGTVGKNWGTGTTKTVGQIKVYASNDAAFTGGGGTITIFLEGSTNGSSWVTLYTSAGFTGTNGMVQTYTYANGIDVSTAYQYHRVRITSSNSGAAMRIAEVQFFDYSATFEDMTLITAYQTTLASVSNARVLFEYDASNSPVFGTDLTAEVTCNGGTNWSAATLSQVGVGQSGRIVAEIPDTACTAGTSFAARVKTLTNKNVPIYGAKVTAR